MVLGGGAAQAGPVLSTQSYYFGIPGTWAGLVAVIAALFPKVKELHSPDRRSSPMTSFEECLTWGGRFTSWRTRYERVSPPMIHGRRCRIPVVNHNSFSNFIEIRTVFGNGKVVPRWKMLCFSCASLFYVLLYRN